MVSSVTPPKPMALACIDSGVGGLAVLQKVLEELPEAAYVFVGDTAWMPYGEKPLDVVKNRVLLIHQYLHQQFDLNAFILACNTGTVAAFDSLNKTSWGYPLLEPVTTTAQWVLDHVAPKTKIGILATPGTVSSGRYLNLLESQFEVCQVGCTGLATLIEQGHTQGPALQEALKPFLEPLQSFGAQVVILGCTHYSLIQPEVQRQMGDSVQLVDSATVMAQQAVPVLAKLGLTPGAQTVCVTGNPQVFEEVVRALPLSAFSTVSVKSLMLPEVTDLNTPLASV